MPHCCHDENGQPLGCTNTQADPNNCGKCGHHCEPGEECMNGACQSKVCPEDSGGRPCGQDCCNDEQICFGDRCQTCDDLFPGAGTDFCDLFLADDPLNPDPGHDQLQCCKDWDPAHPETVGFKCCPWKEGHSLCTFAGDQPSSQFQCCYMPESGFDFPFTCLIGFACCPPVGNEIFCCPPGSSCKAGGGCE
jgi:hypothetical protein